VLVSVAELQRCSAAFVYTKVLANRPTRQQAFELMCTAQAAPRSPCWQVLDWDPGTARQWAEDLSVAEES
jgi:hypothetical protein